MAEWEVGKWGSGEVGKWGSGEVGKWGSRKADRVGHTRILVERPKRLQSYPQVDN
ncbi:MAG: hypothetical protein GPJ22_01750 [Microcystis aeruginosa LL13-03]|jgi:hypothetical protein|nr:hypothetical protein [Microcystis aeruginosa LL13-03]NCR43478.1 hypothetical protein [Microcystis aeruginosa SX13-01]NCR66164.1 hypothetical protein [Microcystis aeruginosa LL11-07]NCS35367.1 hypothetical protein [Microcystis aeruginosa G11-01]